MLAYEEVAFETTLNVVWLLLGLLACVNAVRVSFAGGVPGRRLKWIHVVGIALILAALFPYISATDDILRVQAYASQHEHRNAKPTPSDNLVRLYETLDSPVICQVAVVALTFVFLSLVDSPVESILDRTAPARNGRSPPVFASL